MLYSLIAVLVAAQPAGGGVGGEAGAKRGPHPVITEVLYAVPTRGGDADGNGERSATGDEFVELYNPHATGINLKGYTITDGKTVKRRLGEGSGESGDDDDSRVRFTFPEFTLPPGGVVVVFNGYGGGAAGAVGDEKAGPKGRNERFHGAYVFSMKAETQYIAFANAGDCVLLTDPSGAAVECVEWGESEKEPDAKGPKTERVEERRGSVQRASATGKFVAHQELTGERAGTAFSPGWVPGVEKK